MHHASVIRIIRVVPQTTHTLHTLHMPPIVEQSLTPSGYVDKRLAAHLSVHSSLRLLLAIKTVNNQFIKRLSPTCHLTDTHTHTHTYCTTYRKHY